MVSLMDRFSPEESHEVLRTLINTGVITEAKVRQAVGRNLARQKSVIERLYAKLDDGSNTATALSQVPAPAAVNAPLSTQPVTRGRKPSTAKVQTRKSGKSGDGFARSDGTKSSSLSAEQLASRQLQGKYIAMIRQVPKTKQAPFKAITQEKGREAAIRAIAHFLKTGEVPGAAAKATTTKHAPKKSAKPAKSAASGKAAKPAAKKAAKTAKPVAVKGKALLPRKPTPILDEPDADEIDNVSENFVTPDELLEEDEL